MKFAYIIAKISQVAFVIGLTFFLPLWQPVFASGMNFPGYRITVTTVDQSVLQMNKHVNLLVKLVPVDDQAPGIVDFKFDARMPQHKHGMVTTPKSVKISDLEYRVEGVRLHMAGLWVFEFVLTHKTGETRISSPFDLKPM